MTRSYLVTGGTGFIGAAVCARLVQDGARVRTLDDGSRGSAHRLAPIADHVEMVEGDIRDAEAVRRAARGVDTVIHLAYVNGTENFYKRPHVVLDVAVRGMLSVVDACVAERVGRLVVASSSEVYAEPAVVPTPEDVALTVPDVTNPRYSYSGGKILSELMALNWGREHIGHVTIFRPHNVYGPDMGWEHVIPQLVSRAADAVESATSDPVDLPIQGDGSQTRAFMHVSDCARAVALLCDRGAHGAVYHVGNPEEVSIGDLARRIGRCLGHEVAVQPGELPPGGPARRCPDISRIRALGFTPQVSLDEGLPDTVRWYAEHRQQQEVPRG